MYSPLRMPPSLPEKSEPSEARAASPQMCRPLGKAKGRRASAQTEAEPSRLPYRAIAALSLCNAAHFYSLCSIFSYKAAIKLYDLFEWSY